MGISPVNTIKKIFHVGIGSIITGVAAVLTLLSLIVLLIMNISNMEEMNMETAVLMGEEKLKGDILHLESMLRSEHGALYLQDGSLLDERGVSLAYSHDIVGHLSYDLGIAAAVFIKENNDYRCIDTSIVDSSGNFAVDTFLGQQSAAYAYIQSGTGYTGKDVILDNNYLAAYRPIFQPNTREVIGVLFTGIKMTAIQNTITQKSDMRFIQAISSRTGLIMLGTLLAITLITILTHIFTEKNRAEERLRIIFDAMPLGTNIHKRNFDFIDCNENVVNLFGLSDKHEYFEKFYQLSPEYQPDGRLSTEKREEYTNKAFSEGYCRFEWLHQKLNGEQIPCEITTVRVIYNNDFVLAVYVRDLRELKQIMKEVQQRENLLNTVNSAANILLSVNDEKSFEDSLLKSFELAGNCLDVDRVQIWRNEEIEGELHFVHRYEWLSDYGRDCLPIPIGLHFPYSMKPEWENLFLHGEYINAPLCMLPENDQVFLNPYGMKSIVIIPIFLERHKTLERRQKTGDRRQAEADRRQTTIDRLQLAGDNQEVEAERRQKKDRRQSRADRREEAIDRRQLAANKKSFWGLFSIDDCRRERTFSDEEIRILTSMGFMMSSAVNRNLQSAKLRKADERVRIMFDAMPLGASYHDINFNILDCNEGALNLFGLSDKQEFFDRFNELSPEYQPDGKLSIGKRDAYIDIAFVDGSCCFEWTHQKLNGETIPCEVTLVRVKHYDDFVLAAYIRDLRELKTVITQMNRSRESLNILENILNGIDAMIYVTIPKTGEILFINNHMRMHYKIEGDCIGQLCYKVFQENMDDICDFCPCPQLDKEDPGRTIEWIEHNQFNKRIYRNTDRYIEWIDGRIVHIQHSVDVTELIAAKELAEQSSRFKSQFLSRMSHEVRTPMNAILGITEIQLQNETLPSDLQEAMGKINNSGYLLLGIINDILDLSKIEAGKLELMPAVYSVPSLINETIKLNTMLYNAKHIEFKLQVDENIPSPLVGDELRIKQILNNLLSNAFKYTNEGEISLSVTAEYQQTESSQVVLVFRVTDTGQGMTAEQINMLFDEFTRFNMEANRTVEGAGLGMNITRHLIRLMNGKIDVNSEPGKGSVFTVHLPQGIDGTGVLGKEMTENLKQFRSDSPRHIKNAPKIVREYMPYGRVLVVDDMETNLYVARGLMAPYGLSIETAASGFETIEKIKNGAAFDIIFLDHFMPKMDGIETTEIIRKMGYTRPIIALTANALTGQAEMFLESGFDGFISKPIDIRQLNTSLNKLIRDKHPPEVVEAARRQADKMAKQTAIEPQPLSDPELKIVFVRDAENAFARIKTIHSNSYRRTDDIRQFVTDTHAVKSALANIGETRLSADALELEMAGRNENMPAIIAKTPVFLKKLHKVIDRNKPKEDDIKQEDSKNDLVYLTEKLLAVQKACREYDEVTANEVIAELGQKKWSHPVKEQLDTIAMHLLHSDFEKAANLAETCKNRESS